MKEIKLTKGLVAWVDDEDFERVNALKWCASIESRGTKVYAVRWQKREDGTPYKVRMHRFILDLPPGSLTPDLVVDHLDGNSLNNCRDNLEKITQAENMKRSAGWKKKIEEPCL